MVEVIEGIITERPPKNNAYGKNQCIGPNVPPFMAETMVKAVKYYNDNPVSSW